MITTSRENILERVRAALKTHPPVERPPAPQVWPRFCLKTPCHGRVGRAESPQITADTAVAQLATEQLVEQFTRELEAVSGELIRCGSMAEARRRLIELAERSDWRTLGAVDCPLCRELAAEVPAEQITWTHDGWDAKEIAELSVGLVAAEMLLADTGTCVVANNTAEQRLMCYLPPACVVVATVEQLVEHMPAGWAEIARRTAEPDRRGEFVFITGPSRTADIEKILILGVHGPKRLVVMLVG